MLGYARSEAAGSTWTALNLVANADEAVTLPKAFLAKGQVLDHELQLRTKGGEDITVLLSLVPIKVGGESCVLAIAHDISIRKRSEEALRRAQAELAVGIQARSALEERQRLARELHDSVSQALYGISLGVNTAITLFDVDRNRVLEALNYALSLASAGLAEMRALIFELRPESLEMEGLGVALTKQAAATRARYGIDVELTLCDEASLPLPIQDALYRIALEALHNAVKHARSERVELRLACEADCVKLEVHDNGVGFDPLTSHRDTWDCARCASERPTWAERWILSAGRASARRSMCASRFSRWTRRRQPEMTPSAPPDHSPIRR